MPSHFSIAGTRFPLVAKTVTLGGIAVNLATLAYSPQELDRIVGLVGLKERAWPYWLEDWPASYALAEILAGEDPALWPGPVLDLGCGSGVMGAFLKARFGIEPFSCDFNGDACRLAWVNARCNGGNGGEGGEADLAGGVSAQGRVFCADFRAFPARACFGRVLGGEMLYARENQLPLLTFLKRHLAPGGTALFADPGRSAAEGFPDAALKEGFTVETIQLPAREGHRLALIYKLSVPCKSKSFHSGFPAALPSA